MGRVSQGRGEEGLIQEWMKVRYFWIKFDG